MKSITTYCEQLEYISLIKEQLKDFKLAYFKTSEKRGGLGRLAKFGIKYGKSIFKFLKKILKKAKPTKGGPKPAKNNPKATGV